jgi:hypothetical protein
MDTYGVHAAARTILRLQYDNPKSATQEAVRRGKTG